MRVLHVVGARPNFVKTAPVMAEMSRSPELFEQVLVHTGQHYDHAMSQVFFDDLGLPEPHVFLGVGSGSHAQQTARTMLAFEPVVADRRPDWVFVVGDVNSTLACALVCAKLGVRLAHVEAGLRSRDRSMPEETNRVLTDQLADLLFTPSRDGDENLLNEGISHSKIRFVGNVMIDTLVRLLPAARERTVVSDMGLTPGGFVLVTLHRPANVDRQEGLAEVLAALVRIAGDVPVVFPVHPRTRLAMTKALGDDVQPALRLLEPLGYLDFLSLTTAAGVVLTDSGGIQEETTYLGVPCLTVRPNTERPITVEIGTNRLVAPARDAIVNAVRSLLAEPRGAPRVPELWDGAAAPRIIEALLHAESAARDR